MRVGLRARPRHGFRGKAFKAFAGPRTNFRGVREDTFPTLELLKPITSAVRQMAEVTKVLHLTPWFALFGAIAAPANLLLGNHITFVFWVGTMALPGLVLDLSRMLNGGKAWEPNEGWFTRRTAASVVIVVGIAAPLEAVLDHLGGYQSTNALVNTDWSQLSDAVALSVALPVARQFLQLSKPKMAGQLNSQGPPGCRRGSRWP